MLKNISVRNHILHKKVLLGPKEDKCMKVLLQLGQPEFFTS